MIRVAIFEDNKHLRETFELLISNAEGFECAGAWANCKNIIENLSDNRTDVVLMDIEMPGMSGIEATRILKEKFPALNIIIQTVFFDDDNIFNAICAGASGYILKDTTSDGYLQAIKELQNGGSPMTPGIARRVLELFKTNLQPATRDYELTAQEKKVLKLLVDGKSYKLIAADLILSVDTIKSHIRNIYSKLQVHSGIEAVSLALKDKLI